MTRDVGGVAVSSSSPQGRFAEAGRLDGAVVSEAWARGKHLFVAFEGLAEQVHVHLGLYGALTVTAAGELPIVGQVRWRLQSTDRTFDLRGPTRCELITPGEVETILDRLGPDPLDPEANADLAFQRIARSRLPIAQLLMDQRVIAGVGNVYRAEVLFRHGLDPFTPGNEFARSDFDLVWTDLVSLMREGMNTG
ncbi:MAG: Fpg/Nei family DNA glycosylase, partial [Actinomycetales bacterium]|nr:Fpg/Nei family DNA glycosylase [Actinomycetales bacterium]